MTQKVAVICGRPNVGKSSLFNALLKRRVAIVDPTAGVTRDRVTAELRRGRKSCLLVDTGGMGLFDEIALKDEVERQIGIALALADVVVFVVDTKDGVLPADQQIARELRTLRKPLILAVNKCDGAQLERDAAQFYELGLGEPIAVSAVEKLGVENLAEAILEHSPYDAGEDASGDEAADDEEAAVERASRAMDEDDGAGGDDGDPAREPSDPLEPQIPDRPIRIAIVGKVNSGKSTFLNKVVGEERAIVSDIPGTTRDAIDAPFMHRGRRFIAVDTAGLRKRRVVEGTPDFYGQSRATEALRRADAVLLLVDATRKVSQIDKGIASAIANSSKPVVVGVTKWDLAKAAGKTPGEYEPYLRQQLPNLEFAPIVFLSAMTGFNVGALLDVVVAVYEQSFVRVPTALLNRVIENSFQTRAPRVGRGKFPKILYATQTGVHPPTFVLFVNEKKLFGGEFARFLGNRLREAFPFKEVPMRIHFRERAAR